MKKSTSVFKVTCKYFYISEQALIYACSITPFIIFVLKLTSLKGGNYYNSMNILGIAQKPDGRNMTSFRDFSGWNIKFYNYFIPSEL